MREDTDPAHLAGSRADHDSASRPLAPLAHLGTDVTTVPSMSLSSGREARPRRHHHTVRPLVMTSVQPPQATPYASPSAPTTTATQPARSLRSALVEARGAALVSVALLVVGIALRLHLYLDRRSLWLDEIWVALNVVGRSFLGLARPLDYAQSAPVGFLWVERLAVVIGGVNELALRAFPLLTGCLFLVALWMLARRLLDIRGAALALGFAALSPQLVYFSNEVKPYGSDAFVAVVLIWLALDVLDAPESTRAWRRLLIGGLVGILLSTPSVFVLAGIGVALVAHPVIRGSRSSWLRLVGTGA